jgi:hypothetical protein
MSSTSTDLGVDEEPPNVSPSRGGGFHAAHAPSREAKPSLHHVLAGQVHAYVDDLDAGRTATVCAMFAPGALDQVSFPRQRGDCASSLAASIGYRDPRGLPVWKRSHVGVVDSVAENGGRARVTTTIETFFADRRQPSIEDDLVYFVKRGGDWLIAQPDAQLYRVVGAEPPPQAISPPG